LQICGQHLSPHGVAYISFNTYPGWYVRMWARDAMLFHADGITDPLQRARAGRDFVMALKQSPMGGGTATLLQGEVQYLEGKPESYILHEYLEEWNQPMYFREFARRCAAHGVQYVGDAMHNGALTEQSWPPLQQWM